MPRIPFDSAKLRSAKLVTNNLINYIQTRNVELGISHRFAVGEIVVIKKSIRDGKRHEAFVEEIVRDARKNMGTAFEAIYSLYALDFIPFNKNHKTDGDWYLGDHLEYELTATGRMMTVDSLERYRIEKFPNGGGFAKDINIVIYNLGREAGRNVKEIPV